MKYKIDFELKKFIENAYTVCEAVLLLIGVPISILILSFLAGFKLFGFAMGIVSLFSFGIFLLLCWYKLLNKVIE